MFDTSLEAEYVALAEKLNFSKAEIEKLVENAIDATWADDETKARLKTELGRVAP